MQRQCSDTASDHLAAKANELRERALRMAGSPERDKLLLEAARLTSAARAYRYIASTELKRPD